MKNFQLETAYDVHIHCLIKQEMQRKEEQGSLLKLAEKLRSDSKHIRNVSYLSAILMKSWVHYSKFHCLPFDGKVNNIYAIVTTNDTAKMLSVTRSHNSRHENLLTRRCERLQVKFHCPLNCGSGVELAGK